MINIWSFRNGIKNKKIKPNIELRPGKFKFKTDIGLEPKYTIGKKLKKLKRFKCPGPGAYNIKIKVFNGPKYTMGLKYKEENKNSKNKDKTPLILNIPSDIINNKGFSFLKADQEIKIKLYLLDLIIIRFLVYLII